MPGKRLYGRSASGDCSRGVVSDVGKIVADTAQSHVSGRLGNTLRMYRSLARRDDTLREYPCHSTVGVATDCQFSVDGILLLAAESASGADRHPASRCLGDMVHCRRIARNTIVDVAVCSLSCVAAAGYIPESVRMYAQYVLSSSLMKNGKPVALRDGLSCLLRSSFDQYFAISVIHIPSYVLLPVAIRQPLITWKRRVPVVAVQ